MKGSTIREALEEQEARILGPHAAHARASRGRANDEPEHAYRTAFQRDRDRILHSKAFRRLKRKTQVFFAPKGDHYRTRLTHTLEVSQIARTAARALGLNEDLTEAIAMGHDLGHAPFGHAGETVLNEMYDGGFHHAAQSLRMVDKLETRPNHGQAGLNLTFEVRDGIKYHSLGKAILTGNVEKVAATREGDLLSVADAIAYINHDIDDAIRAGVIRASDLPAAAIRVLGETSSARINAMVGALIEGSQDGPIRMDGDIGRATQELRTYLYKYVYPCDAIEHEIRMAKRMLREIYAYLVERPTEESAAGDPADSLERRTVDFIAGMTDQYALEVYGRLFLPAAWSYRA